MKNLMARELLPFLMDQNIMENGKMENLMAMERGLGETEENILENLKIMNQMEKELLIMKMAQVIVANG